MRFSDEELMAMFNAGTSEAFDLLYERYKHQIYSFALSCLRSRPDSEEVVQDVFLRVARSARSYSPQFKFKAWLFKITVNRIRTTAAQSHKRSQHFSQVKKLYLHTQPGITSAEKTSKPVEVQELLEIGLRQLNETQKMMVILAEIEGMDTMTISMTTGLTPENVRVTLHRARKILRESIGQDTEETPDELH